MPDFAYPLPRGDVENDIDLETAPQTSRLVGGALSAYNQVFAMPSNLGFNKLQEVITKEFDPGKILSSEDYDKSQFKIPGLTFPNGVPTNVARLRFNKFRDRKVIDNAINNMPAGFLSAVSRTAGSLIGLGIGADLDPLAFGVAKGTTSLTSKFAPWLLTKLEGTSARFLTKAAIGGAEGATIATPFALSQYENDLDIGQDDGALSIAANIGMGVGLGASLRLGFGFDRPVMKTEEHQRAQSVAVNHLMNGKPAYVEPLIKNGAYQIAKESDEFLLKSEDMVSKLPDQIDELDKEIDAKSKEVKDAFKTKGLKTDLTDVERGSDFVDRLNKMREKGSDQFSEEENDLQKRFSSLTLSKKEPTVLKKAFDISEKSIARRSPEEEQFLADFVGKKEEDITNNEIDNLKSTRDDLRKRFDETKARDLKTKLRFKIADFEDRISKNVDRLEDIKSLAKLEKPEADDIDDLGKLKTRRANLQNTLDANKVYAQNTNTNIEPVTEHELRNKSTWVQDWRSDFAYSPDESRAFRNEVAAIPDNVEFNIEEPLQALNDLRAAGELSSEEEEFMDQIEKEDGAFDTISKSLRSYFDCLLKRGE